MSGRAGEIRYDEAGSAWMPESLSPREIECVRLAGLGLEDKEIAARLGISPRTVGNHLHRGREVAARALEAPEQLDELGAIDLDIEHDS